MLIILFKVCQQFLLPSVFVFGLILISLIFLWKKKKIGKICLIAGIIFYYIFSITPVADLILMPLENQYQPIQIADLDKAETIVLLLGGGESSLLRAGEVLRIYAAKFLSLNAELSIIISGRSVFNTKINEAERIKNFLVERGVAEEKIILEDQSKNTFKSAENVKKIISEKPFFLVTSAYHLPRAMMFFRQTNTNPIPAPTDYKIEKENYNLLDFFPNSQNLTKVDLAFHEYFGILFYKFFQF